MQVSTNNRGVFAWIPLATVEPPSMTVPESEKGEAYHAAWARYFLSQQSSEWVWYYRNNYRLNSDYSIDEKWGEDADVKLFLGDNASQTSRVPFKYPVMSPTLTRMIGAVDNISISAQAESITQYFASTRRENDLMKAMLMSIAARTGPAMQQAYQQIGVSPDEQKTESMFDMTWQDHVARSVNSIMAFCADRNKLNDYKREVAKNLALSGAAAFYNFINGSNIETKLVNPEELGWDTSADKPDMTDGQYMYVCPLKDVGQVAEEYQPKADIIKALDKWAKIVPYGYNLNAGWPQTRPRVFTMFWKDFRKIDRGFVIKNGELEYCTINEVNPDTGKPDYTDADLQTPPRNKYTDQWTAQELSSKKQSRYIQILRYCDFIPWEYLPGGYTKGAAFGSVKEAPRSPDARVNSPGVVGDIILDYGVYPLQEVNPDDEYSVLFPIKITTWRYIGGHVVAPMTAIRDPQRWINQVASDIAWRLRKAGGKSALIANEAMAGTNMNEDDIRNALKEGDPIFLNASQLNGLPQATGMSDNSPGPGFYNMMSLLPQAKQIAESAIGVYESNYGAPQGQDQLVGTLQLQLQQAGVMQQPFYASAANLYKQQNQFYAQSGKEFYSRHPWILRQMVGEEDSVVVDMTKDLRLEQFRVKVELSMDGAQLRTITDQQVIPGLMQLGMLDPVTAAQLMGRSIPQDVYAAARKYTKQAQQAAQQQAEEAAMQAEAQGLAMEEAAIRDEEADVAREQTKADLDMAKVQQKLMQPQAQAAAEWNKPPEDPSMLTA